MRIIEQRKVEMVIDRGNGKIETVIHPKVDYMTDGILAQMQVAMKKAGRGQVLSYKNIPAVTEMEESDHICQCERCATPVDMRIAKHQKEGKFIAHYCDKCWALLKAVGAGKKSELSQRRAASGIVEQTTKND